MITMPWNDKTTPNVMLEITDVCNVSCTFCYKKLGRSYKSIEAIRNDLEIAERLRPLHTVTLSGGEPTLHPQLMDIIRMIKERGYHTFLLSNGVCLDAEKFRCLKDAGLDSVLLHIDRHQRRKDIPVIHCFEDIRTRLDTLTGQALEAGLDVSLSYTLGGMEQMDEITRYFFGVPELSFLFLAKGVNLEALYAETTPEQEGDLSVERITGYFREWYGLSEYAFIPGIRGHKTGWVSFFAPLIQTGSNQYIFPVHANGLEVFLQRAVKAITGRFIHKTVQKRGISLLRVVVNGLSTFRPIILVRFLSRLRKGRLYQKMVVYDNGPWFNQDGELIHCEYCPTAIVRDDRLVPCCTADYRPT